MLKVAIIEEEEIAKDIIFELGKLFQGKEWMFQYFSSISAFLKADEQDKFPVLFLHGRYNTPRFYDSFFLQKEDRAVIFCQEKTTMLPISFEKFLFIDKTKIKEEIKKLYSFLNRISKAEEEYLFSYNYVSVPIKYRDIFYIEKMDKQLIYHTKKGEFHERKNMKDAQQEFEMYGFLRIHASYLVNMRYITKIDSDSIYLQNIVLPFARNRKQEVREKMESYIHKK